MLQTQNTVGLGPVPLIKALVVTPGDAGFFRWCNDLHGGGAKSLDLVIEDVAGRVVRSVDVTTVAKPFKMASDLTGAIKHVAGKITTGTGAAEGTIGINVQPRLSLGAGRYRDFETGGAWRNVERDGRITASGHILSDLATHLNTKLPGVTEPPVFNLLRDDGSLIGTVEHVGGSWRVRP